MATAYVVGVLIGAPAGLHWTFGDREAVVFDLKSASVAHALGRTFVVALAALLTVHLSEWLPQPPARALLIAFVWSFGLTVLVLHDLATADNRRELVGQERPLTEEVVLLPELRLAAVRAGIVVAVWASLIGARWIVENAAGWWFSIVGPLVAGVLFVLVWGLSRTGFLDAERWETL